MTHTPTNQMDLRTNTNNSNKISTTNTVPFSNTPNSEYINQTTKVASKPATPQTQANMYLNATSDNAQQTPLVRKNNDINSEYINLNHMANNTILYYDTVQTIILFVDLNHFNSQQCILILILIVLIIIIEEDNDFIHLLIKILLMIVIIMIAMMMINTVDNDFIHNDINNYNIQSLDDTTIRVEEEETVTQTGDEQQKINNVRNNNNKNNDRNINKNNKNNNNDIDDDTTTVKESPTSLSKETNECNKLDIDNINNETKIIKQDLVLLELYTHLHIDNIKIEIKFNDINIKYKVNNQSQTVVMK